MVVEVCQHFVLHYLYFKELYNDFMKNCNLLSLFTICFHRNPISGNLF